MSKKQIGITMGVVLALFGMIFFWFAGDSGAHDAPPHGSAECQTTGPDAPWEVLNGSATTENTGDTRVKVTITSSAGDVSQDNGNVKGDGKVIHFTVKNVPAGTSSITVSSTTQWFDNGGGSDTRTTTIARPTDGCLKQVPVPAKPDVLPPTCSNHGQFHIPPNTDSVKWLVDGQSYGQYGMTEGIPGTHQVSAHTTYGYIFDNGEHSVSWTLVVEPQKDGPECHPATSTPPSSSTSSSSSPPSSSAPSTPITSSSSQSSVSSSQSSSAPSSSSASVKSSSKTTTAAAAPKPSSSVVTRQIHRNALVQQTPVAAQKDLASTGSPTGELIAIGSACLLAGLLLLGLTRRSGKHQ